MAQATEQACAWCASRFVPSKYKPHARFCSKSCNEKDRLKRRQRGEIIRRGEAPHGTVGGYTNYKCRCSACREAMNAYHVVRYADSLRRSRVAELGREWRSANPDASRNLVRRRRALLAKADVREVTVRDWRRLCDRYRGCCAYCGTRGPVERDHVIPIARGGRHAIGNLLPVCRQCNASKGSRLLVEWRALRRSVF